MIFKRIRCWIRGYHSYRVTDLREFLSGYIFKGTCSYCNAKSYRTGREWSEGKPPYWKLIINRILGEGDWYYE